MKEKKIRVALVIGFIVLAIASFMAFSARQERAQAEQLAMEEYLIKQARALEEAEYEAQVQREAAELAEQRAPYLYFTNLTNVARILHENYTFEDIRALGFEVEEGQRSIGRTRDRRFLQILSPRTVDEYRSIRFYIARNDETETIDSIVLSGVNYFDGFERGEGRLTNNQIADFFSARYGGETPRIHNRAGSAHSRVIFGARGVYVRFGTHLPQTTEVRIERTRIQN